MGNLREQLAKQLGISVEEFEARIAEKKKREQVEARHAAEQKAASEHGTKAPGYPEARLLPLSEAREILATIPQPPANPSVDGVFDPETFTLPSVQLIDHSLVTDELRLAAEGSNLIIRGDLKVDGILKQDFRAGHLLVMGDLDAGHIVTTSEIACLGNLRVGGLLYGNCNYYCTNVWGSASAAVLMSAKEHYFCFWGGQEIDLLIDVYGDTPNLEDAHHSGATMAEVLLPAVGDGYDETMIYELLRERGTVLKS